MSRYKLQCKLQTLLRIVTNWEMDSLQSRKPHIYKSTQCGLSDQDQPAYILNIYLLSDLDEIYESADLDRSA